MNLITKFETLSNELVMELFEYYDLYSLFFSFSSLNYRLNNLIYNCQVHVDLDQVKSIDFVYFLSHLLPRINPKNIRSLHGSNIHQIAVLAYDKCLIYFNNIRSLSLKNIRLTFLRHMVERMDFSRLERIVIDQCKYDYEDRWSSFKHFLDSNRYHSLRMYKDSSNKIEKVTSILLIEHVTIIQDCMPCDFLNFLHRSPYLKYVKTKLEFTNQYPEPVFLSSMVYNNFLIHLNLEFYGEFCMRTIAYLFQCVPRVRRLKLKAFPHYHPEFVDPLFWEKCLSKDLVELQRISLYAFSVDRNSSNNPVWNRLADQEKLLKQIEKSTYWSSHSWKTTFEINIPNVQVNHYWVKFEVT